MLTGIASCSSQPEGRAPPVSDSGEVDAIGNGLRLLEHQHSLNLDQLQLGLMAASFEIEREEAGEAGSPLLSKIELGQRLPTEDQVGAFARFLGVSVKEKQAKRIADKFWHQHRNNPVARRVATLITHRAAESPSTKDISIP